jgi:Fructose-2,6-bisphosphatase
MIRKDRHSKRHIQNNRPLYDKMFDNVMDFHEGIAAVKDSSGAYHIDEKGEPIYNRRFKETFGFYSGLASVIDDSGAYHIQKNGDPAYLERFRWAGSFQEDMCTVRLHSGEYTYIDRDGKKRSERYDHAGDYCDGVAVIRMNEHGSMYIDRESKSIHSRWFRDCRNYKNGVATVSDERGYFRINKKGEDMREERCDDIYDEYNGEYIRIKDNIAETVRNNGSIELFQIPEKTFTPKYNHVWIKDLHDFEWDSCIIFIRHSERRSLFIHEADRQSELMLTENGIDSAVEIGKEISDVEHRSMSAISSPMGRCKQTAESILKGMNVTISVEEADALGGTAFVHGMGDMNGDNQMPHSVLAAKHICGESIPGWYDAPQGVKNVMDILLPRLNAHDLTICVSHDAFVFRLLGILSGKYHEDKWIDFCDGGLLIRRGKELFLIWEGKEYPIDKNEYRNCNKHLHEKEKNTRSKEEYTWTGDVQEGTQIVRDKDHKYFHVKENGNRIYCQRYAHASDFKDSVAIVTVDGVGSTFITDLGELLNNKWFLECRPYHEGYATVRDERGWFHIDVDGNPLYDRRYRMAEPFYNGFALCVSDGLVILSDSDEEEFLMHFKDN